MPLQHDPTKAAANLKVHGVSFADAEGVLFDPLAVTVEDPDALEERRFVSVAWEAPERSWSSCTPNAMANTG